MKNSCIQYAAYLLEIELISAHLKIELATHSEKVRLGQFKLETERTARTHSETCSTCLEYFLQEEAALHIADALDSQIEEQLPFFGAL